MRRLLGQNSNQQGGFVLITVLTLTFLLFGLAASYAEILLSEKRLVQGSLNSINTQGLAEAGIEQAMWEYNYDSALFTGWSGVTTKTKTINGFTDANGNAIGNYSVSVNTATNIITSSSTYTNAYGGGLQSVVEAKVAPKAVFSSAVKAKGLVSFNGNAYTDSYNSSNGAYNSSTNVASNGDIVTNSNSSTLHSEAVNWNGSSHINGDVNTGSSGTTSNTTDISGTISHTANEIFDDVTVPSSLTVLPDLGTLNSTTTLGDGTSTAKNYHYSSVDLGSHDDITINGNVVIYLDSTDSHGAFVTEDLEIGATGKVTINSGSSLTIYTNGNVNANGSGIINNNSSTNPGSLKIYGTSTCTAISLGGNSSLSGVIYAPYAAVSTSGSNTLYGSIVANTVSLGQPLHYDEALESNGPVSGYQLSWYRRIS